MERKLTETEAYRCIDLSFGMGLTTHMETAKQFMATPVTKTDRDGALGCWAPRMPRDTMAAAVIAALATCVLSFAPAVFAQRASDSVGELLTGKAAFGDWRTDAPLVRRKITDLPPPYATRSASNPPRVVAKPASFPNVPPGFQVELFASNLRDPRTVRVAPNGDIFIAESEPGRIRVLRAAEGAAKPSTNEVFASGLDQPFGIAFYPPGSDPQWIYVANTGSVVRYPYRSGDLKARGKAEVIVRDLPARRRPLSAARPHYARHCFLQRRPPDVRLGRIGIE